MPHFFFEVPNGDWASAAEWVASQLPSSSPRGGNDDAEEKKRRLLNLRQRAMLDWWARLKERIAATVADRVADIEAGGGY